MSRIRAGPSEQFAAGYCCTIDGQFAAAPRCKLARPLSPQTLPLRFVQCKYLMKDIPRSPKSRLAIAFAFMVLAAVLGSQPAPREHVGPLPGGGFLLNSGWRLAPVGQQVPQ